MSNKADNTESEGLSKDALLQRIAALEAELETLRASIYDKDLIEALFERNPNPIIITDPEGVPIRVNRTVIELLGVAPPPGYSMFEDPVFARLGLLDAVNKLRDGETVRLSPYTYNPREISKELPDNPMQFQLVAFPLFNDAGRITSHVVLLDNVTAQKQAEDAVQRQKDFLQVVLDSLHDTVFVVEVETGNIVAVNETACAMFGYNREEFLQLSLRELSIAHPEFDLEGARKYFDDAFDYGPQTFEWLGQRKDGSKLWVELSIRFTRFNGLGRFVVAVKDISERKRITAALVRSEEHYRRLSEDMPAFMCQFLPDSTLTYVNQACCVYFNRDAEDLVGRKFLDLLPKDQCEKVRQHYMSLTPESPARSHEQYQIDAQGRKTWQRWTNRAFFDAEGRVEYFQALGIDITDRILAEQERMEMERRLLHTQKLESLGVLAGGIAHDFNNLLQAIQGNMELAVLDVPENSSAAKNIQQALQAASHAAGLTQQMLAYSGQGAFLISRLDLNALVKDNAQILRSAISRKVELDITLAERLPLIEADSAQLQQVVMNLITNAAEAMEGASGLVMLRTGADWFGEETLAWSLAQEKRPAPGLFVWLEVSDTGCGMSEETVQRIFDPFFTTKFTGRGLGMAAVQGIIQGHKGAIFVNSTVGKGASFKVLFPALGESESAYTENLPAGITAADIFNQLSTMQGGILVVDDEPMLLEVCKDFVTQLGFEFFAAPNGREAIATYQTHANNINCVIMDLSMPNMDGITAFKKLHAINPSLKIIMSSGYNPEEMNGKFNAAQPAGFIHKPYTFETFQLQLWQALLR